MKYWVKLLHGKNTKLSYILYKLLRTLYGRSEDAKFKWIECVQSILQNCCLNFVWLSQNVENIELLLSFLKQILNDQFQQKWVSDCNESSKGIFYNLLTKCIFTFRKYLCTDIFMDNVITLARFRTSNHKLPIETGRWNNIPRDQRICHLCGLEMGDEYHYIMKCSVFNESRRLYVPQVYTQRPNTLKFYNLFSCEEISVINNPCKFIKIIDKRVFPPG
jgi:hypothetical protein